MIAKSSTNPVFLAARTGAETAAKELSAQHGIADRDEWLTPPQEDGQVQAQRIAQAVKEGASAILISGSDAGKVTGAINDAVARGVPVMTFDSDAPSRSASLITASTTCKAGEDVMGELARLLGGKGQVAILAGNQNAPNLRRRVEGVRPRRRSTPASRSSAPSTRRDAAGRGRRGHPGQQRLPRHQGLGDGRRLGAVHARRCSPISIRRR